MQTQAIKRDNYVETEVIRVGGLECQTCVSKLTSVLGQVAGVRDVAVSLETEKATITFEPEVTSKQLLRAAVERAGFQAIKPVHGEDGNCCGGCGG